MLKQNNRKAIKHFFIKRSLQIRIILQTFGIVLTTTLVTTIILALVYNEKSEGGSFYYMSNNVMQDLEFKSILGIILPSLIVAQIISILTGIWIGLIASRKVAVPIYKFERWVQELKMGRLTTTLSFREKRENTDLVVQCNAMADVYRRLCADMENNLAALRRSEDDPSTRRATIEEMDRLLQSFTYRS